MEEKIESKQINEILIKEFISAIENDYNKKITLGYSYDKEFEGYRIWHNIKNYNEDDFNEFLGEKVSTMLYDKDIFDFYIVYDESMAKQLLNNFMIPEAITIDVSNILGNSEDRTIYSTDNNASLISKNPIFKMPLIETNIVLENNITNNRFVEPNYESGQGVAA